MRRRPYSLSLNLRLWLVVALACLPVVLMAVADFRQQRRDAAAHLQDEVERMRVTARLAEEHTLRSLRQTFQIMERADNLRTLSPEDCSLLAQRLLLTLQDFDDLGAALPDGRVFCSARDFAGARRLSMADRAWFQHALKAPGLGPGELVHSRLTGQPSVTFGFDVPGADGAPLAVLFATLPLAHFDQLVQSLQLPDGWNAFVLSAQGQMLAYHPPRERPAMAKARAVQDFWDALARGERVTQLQRLDGRARVYGLLPSRLTAETADNRLMTVIGAPLDRSLARIEQGFWLRLALLAAIALASALLARAYISRLIEAWRERMADALERIAAGQLHTRIAPLSPVRELAGVERGINQMAASLAQREGDLQRLSAAVEQSPVGMLLTDPQACILYANPAAERMTGYSLAELRGRHVRMLHHGPVPQAAADALWSTLRAGRVYNGEFTNQRKDGSCYIERTTVSPILDAQGRATHYVSAMEDITARKESEALIERLAYFDELTGLPNRAQMHRRMVQAIDGGAHARGAALLLLDIDRFKHINDTWGHGTGDALLRQVAQRTVRQAGAQHTVARLGSNTFGVLACDLGADAPAAARALAEALQQALAEPMALADGQRLYASTSAGVALLAPEVTAPGQLLKQAEVAMYRAKGAGGGALELFDAAMQASVDARAQLEMGLRAALDAQAFTLHYQAQVGPGGQVLGAEALLRWSGADGTPISPAQFIPVAEDTGLIVPIGRWVLETACRQLALWQAGEATRHLRLSVNVSARQFHQGEFADMVRTALAASGADARGLTLELTESAILGGIEATIARMHALRALGLRFALDDFGTGYSSLSYLQRLPFDELKIDQSFIRAMLTDATSSAIVRAVLALGEAMGVQVVAEGVETAEHRDFLARQHCHHCQGYWFGRPMAIDAWEQAHLAALSVAR